MVGRVDEVDEEVRVIFVLFNAVQVVFREFVEEGDGGGFDCDVAFLFIFAYVSETCFFGFGGGNDVSFVYKGVVQRGFVVVYMEMIDMF